MSKSLTSYMSNQADLPMRSKAPLFLSVLLSACLVPALAVAESKAPPAGLSATQIVDKHVAARGGLQPGAGADAVGERQARCRERRLRGAQRETGPGRAGCEREAGGSAGKTPADSEKGTEAHEVQLPFRLEMKRPRKSRFEVDFAARPPCRSTTVTRLETPALSQPRRRGAFTADEAKSEASKSGSRGSLG